MRRTVRVSLLVVGLMVLALPALAADEPLASTDVVFDLVWIGGTIAFFLPLAISFLKRQSWSTQTKKYFAFGISALAGVVNTGIQAAWAFDSVGQFASLTALSVVDVYVASSVIYRNFWEGTSPEQALASVGGDEEPDPLEYHAVPSDEQRDEDEHSLSEEELKAQHEEIAKYRE